ncbi:TPM domain-containing protein [uncultured Mobiluncus sp.]|uniref:TPM domain-containing protein n=1 Tax=uncultured Mobiluncus sp. TaxID=293425 RepID=UPI0025D5FAB5|nr:TPM domain-containing protein [uncultured Mobiluncus sp.]
MNMRKKILFSAGALAVALAPAVGFAMPAAAGAEVSPTAVSGSAPERVVRGETSNTEFIYDDADYLDANQEARLTNIAKAVWQTSGHRIIYISTTDPAMEDDPDAWLDDYAKAHNISLDSVILVAGGVNYTTTDGQTSDAISDADWEQLLKKSKTAADTHTKRADSFFMTFADYLNKHPLERAGSPAAASQPTNQTPPLEESETPEASEEPADSADLPLTEFGDIIKFPYGEQFPYVGGQSDVKSAAPFIRDHSEVFSKSKIAGWEKQMTALADKYGIAPYIVTVDDFRYQTPQKWGANYYNVNQLGLGEKDASGVLMVINPSSRDLWFLGHGAGEQAFTVYGIEKLYDHVKQPLGDDHWDDGVDVYLTQVADYLEQWKAGTPYSASHPLPHPITLESTTAGVAGAAALGGGAGTLVMRRIRKKHDTAHLQWGAIYYVVPGSDQITGSNDVFVNEYITHVARPKSSGSSGHHGGSFRSGGTSFSSGGGKF